MLQLINPITWFPPMRAYLCSVISSGLEGRKTFRREGAPIPLKSMGKWDGDRDLVLAGDAAGVVAAATASACLKTGRRRDLGLARKPFMREHKQTFRVLGAMQNAYCRSDARREHFVFLCHDLYVQRLTFEAYMDKKLVKARPMAHLKIGIKNLAHLSGLVSETHV